MFRNWPYIVASKCILSLILLCAGALLYAQNTLAKDTPTHLNIYHAPIGILPGDSKNLTHTQKLLNRVKKVLDDAKISHEFKSAPWNRIIRQAPQESNSLIFLIIRTNKRENSFHWITPLRKINGGLYLFTRNSPEIAHLSKTQIVEGPYKSICQIKSAQCDMLLQFGFSKKNILKISTAEINTLEKIVIRKRADFMINSKIRTKENLRILNLDPSSLVPLFKIHSNMGYLAAPKSINPELLIKLKAAFKNFPLQEAYQ